MDTRTCNPAVPDHDLVWARGGDDLIYCQMVCSRRHTSDAEMFYMFFQNRLMILALMI